MPWRNRRSRATFAAVACCPQCQTEALTLAAWTAESFARFQGRLVIYCPTCRCGQACTRNDLRLSAQMTPVGEGRRRRACVDAPEPLAAHQAATAPSRERPAASIPALEPALVVAASSSS